MTSEPAEPKGAMLEKLRDESIATQKAWSEMLKWKYIAIGAVGSVAFGGPRQFLALIPPLCVLADAMIAQLQVRIRVIGRYMRYRADPAWREYETYCNSVGFVFMFDGVGVWYATVVICAVLGFASGRLDPSRNEHDWLAWSAWVCLAIELALSSAERLCTRQFDAAAARKWPPAASK